MLSEEQRKRLRWDTPDPALTALEKRFLKDSFDGLPYRAFIPAAGSPHERRTPLVVYLHGADDKGTDNVQHLTNHHSGCVFAEEGQQEKRPCYILAPQCPEARAWRQPPMKEALFALIRAFVQEHTDIDDGRIYLYGSSMGAIGGMALVKDAPDFFAGALFICGATKKEGAEALLRTPAWFFHAEDDAIVPAGKGGDGSFLGSIALFAYLKELDAERAAGESESIGGDDARLRLTTYSAGEIEEAYGINPHCAWVPALAGEEAKAWLFSNRRQ